MPEISRVSEKIRSEIRVWCASPWLTNLFYFMDGKRSLGELYCLLHISDFPVDRDIFIQMLDFLEKDGMVCFAEENKV